MAVLTDPHWEQVPTFLRQAFTEIGQFSFARRFYLAGGTAAALQLGHRVSVDLDFFSTSDELGDESRREIIAALQGRFSLQVVENVFSTLLINVQGSFVGFFSYSYALLAPVVMLEGVALAGLLDIGLMKMDAVAGRGSRKDFYDLYFIAQRIPLDEMLGQAEKKYPFVRDFSVMALSALVDFAVAERQAPIETFPPLPWDEVKDFFIQETRRIGRQWFEPGDGDTG
jgi:hypothetical protein